MVMHLANQEKDWSYLEKFLSESFGEEQVSRELRLSPAERDYIQTYYPSISVSFLDSSDTPKGWYLVTAKNKGQMVSMP